MRHASLFSGIGGFDLAAQWMGWDNVFQVEKDGFCQKVLAKNFPNTKRYGDIKEFDGTIYRGAVDILTGGFPCQPFSLAGKRLGVDDSRHLWPEMLRVIREIQPAYVVGENVFGITNWSNGMVFEMVCSDLETEGYQVTSFILPAAGVGTPHRRDRCWFVAHANGSIQRKEGYHETRREAGENEGKEDERVWSKPERVGNEGSFAYPEGQGRGQRINECRIKKEQSIASNNSKTNDWEYWPTVPGVCGGNNGVPNRMDRIKSLGNAIVPQVAFQIFKAIEQTMI